MAPPRRAAGLTRAVVEEPPSALAAYARVPIAFTVRARLDPVTGVVHAVAPPWTKDYDALDGGPASWPARFDVARWGLLAAFDDGTRVGGAAVYRDGDDAVLWDLRVAPDARRTGVGSALLGAAERWARVHGARRLTIETQDVNVAACRLYARHGYALVAAAPGAYAGLPDETRLTWAKPLGA